LLIQLDAEVTSLPQNKPRPVGPNVTLWSRVVWSQTSTFLSWR